MHAEVIGNRSLRVTVFFDCFGYFLVSFAFIGQNMLSEYFIKLRPVGVALALGYLRYVFMLPEVIRKAVDKIIFAKKRLALHLVPDCVLADPPLHKLTIFLFGLDPRSAE
jgi:hypothetical protein